MNRGAYLTNNVDLQHVAALTETFNVKGGGQMIDLFARTPDAWYSVGDVQRLVRLQGVVVDRKTVRTALNQLSEKMMFLEKVFCGTGRIQKARYRRKLNEAQREARNGIGFARKARRATALTAALA